MNKKRRMKNSCEVYWGTLLCLRPFISIWVWLQMNRPKIIFSHFLKPMCLFPCSRCCATRKQNGSGCRVPSSQHSFAPYIGEITRIFISAFWLNYLPFTFTVILNHFIDFNKKAPDNYRIWSTFSTDRLKNLATEKTEECKIYSGETKPTLCSD